MSSGGLTGAAIAVADAAVEYNAARKQIMNLRHTAKIREERDGTPVIAQAGAEEARNELKRTTDLLDRAVARYETEKALRGL